MIDDDGGWLVTKRSMTDACCQYPVSLRLLLLGHGAHHEQGNSPGRRAFCALPPIGDKSLRDLVVHILDAERSWRQGWSGRDRPPRLAPSEFPTIAAFAAAWETNQAEMRQYLAGLSAADLEGLFIGLPLWTVLTHVANHGMQHRSEAAVLLTHYGQSPGDIDLLFFSRERFQAQR